MGMAWHLSAALIIGEICRLPAGACRRELKAAATSDASRGAGRAHERRRERINVMSCRTPLSEAGDLII